MIIMILFSFVPLTCLPCSSLAGQRACSRRLQQGALRPRTRLLQALLFKLGKLIFSKVTHADFPSPYQTVPAISHLTALLCSLLRKSSHLSPRYLRRELIITLDVDVVSWRVPTFE